ncbi:hypothetical protein B0T25DRAFT_540990 [Lasiosphaeria hispida]|uniref:Uncharacterized protein n=1 Tax=Lasiosphaeria hispida TaxID=260671 RepID=A0AAJ0MH30_9PEZI|nr:hypothetical protein B0T25DRAFT_540990 [Lasiosphaeria hispida]
MMKPSFMSLYVQLSRVERWEGLYLFWKPGRADFIKLKNVLGRDMWEVILRLERVGEETWWCFEQDYRCESWFQDWDAMPESTGEGDSEDEEEALL